MQTGLIKPTEELVRYIFEQYGIRIDAAKAVPDSPGNNNPGNEPGNEPDNNASAGGGNGN